VDERHWRGIFIWKGFCLSIGAEEKARQQNGLGRAAAYPKTAKSGWRRNYRRGSIVRNFLGVAPAPGFPDDGIEKGYSDFP
jgi:hypothetical protein